MSAGLGTAGDPRGQVSLSDIPWNQSASVEPAPEFLILLTKVKEVLIKLDRVNRYPALLSGEFFCLHILFLSKVILA
jgi:hypothetical protein